VFKSYDQKQTMLLPLSVEEFVALEHPARTVSDIVDGLDLSLFLEKYCVRGASSYDPRMMLKVLFYAYADGVTSSRDIADLVEGHTVYMYLAGMQRPDHRTLCRFRVMHSDGVQGVFLEIVRLCISMGMVGLGNVSFDGTKIKANASGKRTKDKDLLDKQIRKWMDESEKQDREEDEQYGEEGTPYRMPPHLRDPGERKRLIREKIEELKKEKEKVERSGEERVNLTDPDAKLMKTRRGTMPAYNGQLAVDGKNQVILAAQLVKDVNDVKQLIPRIEEIEKNTGRKPWIMTADSGYFSLDNYDYLEKRGLLALIPDTKYHLEKTKKTKFYPRTMFQYNEKTNTFTCPTGKLLEHSGSSTYKDYHLDHYLCKECKGCVEKTKCTNAPQRKISRNERDYLVQNMRTRLDNPIGSQIYQERMSIVEPVNGNIKENMGFRQFRLRGQNKTNTEFNLVCIAHNLMKIHEHLKQTGKHIVDEMKKATNHNTREVLINQLKKPQTTPY
jgi:transposase